MTTAAKKGTDLIFYLGAEGSEEEFAAQRDFSFSTEYDELEASNKLSPDDKGEWKQGRGNATAEVEAVGILEDAAAFDVEDVIAAAYNGTVLTGRQYLNEAKTKWLEFKCFFTGATLEFPDNDIFVISSTLRITGGWEVKETT